jgi:ribosome-binding protein aMBF1 (putative translation factor)
MPKCAGCGENVDELQMVKVDGKAKKLCDECADVVREGATVAEESEAAVQQMMGFKGRR